MFFFLNDDYTRNLLLFNTYAHQFVDGVLLTVVNTFNSVINIYYYKLGFKPVPKIKPKSYDIKKLFEIEKLNELNNFQKERIAAFDDIEKRLKAQRKRLHGPRPLAPKSGGKRKTRKFKKHFMFNTKGKRYVAKT